MATPYPRAVSNGGSAVTVLETPDKQFASVC